MSPPRLLLAATAALLLSSFAADPDAPAVDGHHETASQQSSDPDAEVLLEPELEAVPSDAGAAVDPADEAEGVKDGADEVSTGAEGEELVQDDTKDDSADGLSETSLETAEASPPAMPPTLTPEARAAATAELKRLIASNRVNNVQELYERAMAYRGPQVSGRKMPQVALSLLRAIAAARADTELVTEAQWSAAALEAAQMLLRGEGTAVHVREARRLLEQAAETGEPEAQFLLGVLFASGIGIELNVPLSLTYFYFAAEGGSIGAQLALGYRHLLGVRMAKQCQKALLYYNPVAEKVAAGAQKHKAGGQVIEKVRLTIENPLGNGKQTGPDDEVIQYYEHSARKGSVDAQMTLAHLHYHGARGVPVNVERAFQLYSRAAAAGEAGAYSHLGHMYAQGIGVAQNNATALDYFRKGAAKGHPAAYNGLGYMYMHGHGVQQSYKKALENFKSGAEKGNAEAQYHLGTMYMQGVGVKKAYEKAFHHLTLAAHQGHTLALFNLGQMHLNGVGTPRSCPVAVQYLKAVAERGPWGSTLSDALEALQRSEAAAPIHLYATLAEGGYEVAQSNVAFLLDQHFMKNRTVHGLQGAQLAKRAFDMYRRAAQQGNVQAEMRLGDYHYYGYGVEPDLEAAVQHYRTAAELRNAQAMFSLAYMYVHGLGVSRDFHLAKRHYDMAIETASEAYIPVQLALLELNFLQLWQEYTGRKESPWVELAAFCRRWLAPFVSGEDSAASEWMPQWDTLLIIVLTIVLAYVISLRMRSQHHGVPAVHTHREG